VRPSNKFVSLSVFGFVFLTGLQKIYRGDILWHVPFGRYFFDHGALPTHDIFSHTQANSPIMPHSPLFQILVGGFFHLGGWPSLIVLRALLVSLIFLFLVLIAKRFGSTHKWTALFLLPLLLLSDLQLVIHPQLFFFLFSLILFWLSPFSIFEKPPGHPFTIPPIFLKLSCLSIGLLWTFIHPSFIVGILILLLFSIHFALEPSSKKMALGWLLTTAFLVFAIILISPDSFRNLWSHHQSSLMQENIHYWKPIWKNLAHNPLENWVLFHLLGIGASFLFLGFRKKMRPLARFEWFALGVCVILATLRATRFYPLVPLLLGPPVISWIVDNARLNSVRGRQFLAASWVLITIVLLVTSSRYKLGLSFDETTVPKSCVDYMEQNNLPGKLFNSYTFGGYLMFRLGSSHPVFIDPRSTQIYPDDFFERFLKAYEDPRMFETLASEYGVGHTMLKVPSLKTQRLRHHLDSSLKWKTAYSDPKCIIHKRATDPI